MTKLALLASLLLSGCFATGRTAYVPYETRVPVAVPCAAQVPSEPQWATGKLTRADEIDVKVDALLAERKQHQGYEKQLRAATEGCR